MNSNFLINMKTELDDYRIKLTMSASLPIDGWAEDYFTEIKGEVFYVVGDGNLRLCGKLNCYFINLEQVRTDGFSYFTILDDHSSELAECAKLFKPRQGYESNFRKATLEALGMSADDILSLYNNFVYVRRLEILPSHRGKGLGKFVLNETLTYLAQTMNFVFYAMKPFPLQSEKTEAKKGSWRARLKLEALEPSHQKAMKKLRKLYGELGFVAVRGTSLMVCQTSYYANE